MIPKQHRDELTDREKGNVPVPRPFMSFYTPTYKRPKALDKCKASVQNQVGATYEQLEVHDHVGIGIGGMYRRIPEYAPRLTGQYVHILADDDVLAAPDVVARVQAVARDAGWPDVLIVTAMKNGMFYPLDAQGPPIETRIDLGCVITRRDIWLQHVQDYSEPFAKYESDYQHVRAMWDAGRRFHYATDIVFEIGPASHGQPE